MLLIPAGRPAARADEPPAASVAFVSRDRVVRNALALMNAGQFQKAEALLEKADRPGDAATLRARTEAREILRRTRIEYSLDAPGLLAKVRRSVPDATAEEVERWARDSGARYRVIDGRKLYFRREPQNIFLFCAEARERRARAGRAPAEPQWKLTDHLQAIVAEAERTGQAEVHPVRHRITFTLTMQPNLPGVKTGSLVRVWLPYPQEYRQQREVRLIRATPEPRVIAPNAIDGKQVGGAPQRTIYMEQRVTDPGQPLKFEEVFAYTCYAYYPRLEAAKAQPLPADWGRAYLEERLPHIAFTPELRRQAAAIVRGETNPLTRALRIFRWVSTHIKWNAEDEYGTIPSFARKGFAAGRGDCGVQATVFVTLCRLAGIPARWQSGLEIKPTPTWGMHDWAEIYVAPWGWLPVDVSYGVQPSSDPRIADFYCGHLDSYRTIFNLDWGRELVPPKSSLRSEPADFQRGEIEVDGRNLYFDQWDYSIAVECDPGPSPR